MILQTLAGRHEVADEPAMIALGRQLAGVLADVRSGPDGNKQPDRYLVTLSGDLGAGKSVLARAVIHALGFGGAVKSPTYTIVEQYNVADWHIAHFDLYRMEDPEELQFIGFRDIMAASNLVLVEWPDNGGAELPQADLRITVEYGSDNARCVLIEL